MTVLEEQLGQSEFSREEVDLGQQLEIMKCELSDQTS